MTSSIRFAVAGLALATLLLFSTELGAQEEEGGNAVQSGTAASDAGQGIAGSTATDADDASVADETDDGGTAPAMDETMMGGYCPPGCIVPDGTGMSMNHDMTTDHTMGYGMTHQGMMGGGTLPMLSAGLMFESPLYQGALPGMGPGLMAQGTMPSMAVLTMVPTMAPQRERLLTVDDVRPVLEHHIAMMGLPNLQLGSIEEQDDDTIVAEIVLRDGTLVQRLAVDRQRGSLTPLP